MAGKDQEIKPGVKPGKLEEHERPVLRRMLRDAGLTFRGAEPGHGAGEDVDRIVAVANAWIKTDEGRAEARSPNHGTTLAFSAYWKLYHEQA